MTKSIAIVGSGFLGLTLAKRLSEAGHRVTVFESADQIGGLAAAWKIGDVTWDKHYHVTLASDSYTRKIVEEIGLGDEFNWVETKTGFLTDGKLYSMSDTMEFLRFPPLGLVGKLRLGGTIFYASRQKDWKSLEKVTVEKWLTRLSGKKTFDKIWRPLLKAKLGEAYKDTSAAFIWSTIQRMYAARNSGLKKEMFGYVRGGYARVLARFGEILVEKGVEIRLNSKVEKIERLPCGEVQITTAKSRRRNDSKPKHIPQKTKYGVVRMAAAVAPGFSGGFLSEPSPVLNGVNRFVVKADTNTFDDVILTCPSSVAAKVLPQLSDNEKTALSAILYQGIICASVLMKRDISKFYVTNITDDSPFTGVIEMSALVDKKEFGNKSLVYLPKYVAPDDELFEKSDDEVREIFIAGLEKMYPNFNQLDVLEFKVSRVRQVFPLPVLNYSDKLPGTKTSVKGIHVVNSSHIVNGTLNVNETVQLAERFLEEFLTAETQRRRDL